MEDRSLDVAILGSRGYPSTYGGYETFVRHVAEAWTARGHRVTVYCRSREGRHLSWTTQGIRCIWTPGLDTNSASTLSYGLTSHLGAAFRRHDVALVVNVANGYFLPALRAAGIASVLNTDGLEWTRGKWSPAAKAVFYQGARAAARFADVLVSDSQHIADIWLDEFGKKPVFIPYGGELLTEQLPDALRQVSLTSRSYVLVVARIAPENNVDLTLDALEVLQHKFPAIVVGTASYRSPTEDRLAALAGEGKIQWLGHVADQRLLSSLWQHCGVYVHGHSVGGTNPALLQALGAGAPTLALDTPFNREVLRADDQTYPHDANALAHRIESVMTSPAIQMAWSGRGPETVRARYSWGSVHDLYEAALGQAVRIRRKQL
jgi:glycosyltransferase involved in cell wall biosynthesis